MNIRTLKFVLRLLKLPASDRKNVKEKMAFAPQPPRRRVAGLAGYTPLGWLVTPGGCLSSKTQFG